VPQGNKHAAVHAEVKRLSVLGDLRQADHLTVESAGAIHISDHEGDATNSDRRARRDVVAGRVGHFRFLCRNHGNAPE
jgi:hypothetical protein